MTRMLHAFPVLAALTLAVTGCDTAAEQSGNASNAAVPDDYAARVAALPAGQRDAVLFRAIRDAGRTCQQVAKAERVDPVSGAPAWAATCDDGGVWVVALNPGGVATVTAGNDAAKADGR